MVLKIIGSSSNGNCYILENEKEALIIEVGVSFNLVKNNVDISKVVGALITHEHGDHCKGYFGVVESGRNIYASKGTNDFLKSKIHTRDYDSFFINLPKEDIVTIGGFGVYSFDALHDVVEPLSFLIHHKDIGCVLFATDTRAITKTFNKVDLAIIEANYDSTTLKKRTNDGTLARALRSRVVQSHLGFDSAMIYLNNMDRSALKKIVLIHLSDSNSNANYMYRKVVEAFGIETFIADKQMIIDL